MRYTIQHQDVDANRTIRLHTLENYLLNAAGISADSMGFGYHYLLKQDKAWVIVRFSMEMTYMPTIDDVIDVETWVSGAAHMLSPRSFRIWKINENEEKVEIGKAASVWAVIDLQTREMVNVFDQEVFKNREWSAPVDLASAQHLRPLHDNYTGMAEHHVVYSDIDYNGHCNSCRYLEMMLNSLPDMFNIADRKIRIDINYQKESHFGDVLKIKYLENNDGYLFDISNIKGETICLARL